MELSLGMQDAIRWCCPSFPAPHLAGRRMADRQTDQCIYHEESPRYCSAERLAVGGGSSAGDACEQKKAGPSEKGSCKWSQNGSGAIPTPQQGLSRIQS